MIDWEYSPWQGLPPHYRFVLKQVEAPERKPRRALATVVAAGRMAVCPVETVDRIMEDTGVVRQLKALYAHTCQVCKEPLNRRFGDPLVEGHHIRPTWLAAQWA